MNKSSKQPMDLGPMSRKVEYVGKKSSKQPLSQQSKYKMEGEGKCQKPKLEWYQAPF